jgi:hypothetical protein
LGVITPAFARLCVVSFTFEGHHGNATG